MAFLLGIGLRDVIDIAIVAVLLYAVLVWFKQTKALFVAGGIFILGAVYIVARHFGLTMTAWLFQGFFAIFLIVMVVIFQEELRSFFERIAVWSLGHKRAAHFLAPELESLVQTLADLAGSKTGAIIVLKGRDPLERHLQSGYELGGRVSEPLLKSLFDPHSPGHDGAVVIEQNLVTRFGCQLPLSKDYQKIQGLGTRHTAALGITERTDAICLVISEERGTISAARNGTLTLITDLDQLAHLVSTFLAEKTPQESHHWAHPLFQQHNWEKAAALLFSAGLWFVFVQGTKVETRRFSLPVRLHNLPTGLTVQRVDPPRVHTDVSGLKRDLYLLDPESLFVSLDLSAVQEGNQEVVLSERNIHLPSDMSVIDTDPLSVRLILHRIRPGVPSATGNAPAVIRTKMLSAADAEEAVWELPEVQGMAVKMKKRGAKPFLHVESEPNPRTQTIDRQAYTILFGEKQDGRTSRAITFEVNAWTGEVSVFDEEEDALLPLQAWRKIEKK